MKVQQYSTNTSPGSLAWLVWGLAAAFYFSDYMARVAPSVMHHQLQLDLGMSEAGFGILTASFYIPYILMQLPVGLAVDRASTQKLLAIMSVVTALGCYLFSTANGLPMAAVGRMCIGFSAAFAFVGALRLATSWFPPVMLGLLAGLTQALGMLGAASGDAPVSFLVGQLGWRQSMVVMAVMFLFLAALLYRFIKDAPDNATQEHETPHINILMSLKQVLSHKQTWFNAFYAGFLFAPSAVLGEALGPAYLQYGRGFTAHAAAFAIGLIFIGWGVGGPIAGWFSDRIGRRKPFLVASALCGLVLISVLLYFPGLQTNKAYFLLFLFGFTNTGVAITYALTTELHPRHLVGTALAFTNMASIFVGACMQPLVGYVIDLVAKERAFNVALLNLADFQVGLNLLPLCSLIALILSLLVKETYCHPQYSK